MDKHTVSATSMLHQQYTKIFQYLRVPTHFYPHKVQRKDVQFILRDIADNLSEEEINNLIIGSNVEKEFKVSIKKCLVKHTHFTLDIYKKHYIKEKMKRVVRFCSRTPTAKRVLLAWLG